MATQTKRERKPARAIPGMTMDVQAARTALRQLKRAGRGGGVDKLKSQVKKLRDEKKELKKQLRSATNAAKRATKVAETFGRQIIAAAGGTMKEGGTPA